MTGDGVVLETDRLWLRPWRVTEAAIQRELWTERDPRVPAHRRIDAGDQPVHDETGLSRLRSVSRRCRP